MTLLTYIAAGFILLVLIAWAFLLQILVWRLQKEHDKAVKHNEESLNFKPYRQ